MKRKMLTIVTLLVLALIVGALNIPVMATEFKGATVTDDTAADTKLEAGVETPTITSKVNGDKQEVEVVYTVAALKIVTGEVEDRPEGYAWVGVKVAKPTGATKGIEDDEDKTEYEGESFNQYFGVNLKKLQEAVENGTGYISYTKTYTWQYDAEATEVKTTTLTVKIKAEGVTLADKDGEDKTLWNQDEYNTYKLEVKLEELRTELEKQGLAQAEIEKRLELAENLLAKEDLTLEQLKTKLAELTKPVEEAKPTEKDDTPKTGVVDVALIASVVAMISVAGIVTVKKYNK